MTAPSTSLRNLPDATIRLDIETFARAANIHPELARRFVCLGLLEATSDSHGELWFATTQIAAAARLQRLRAGLGMNYAALGVVVDLLDRVARLEATLRRQTGRRSSDHTATEGGGRTWT